MIIMYLLLLIFISYSYCNNCSNYIIAKTNEDVINNVSSIINSVGFISHINNDIINDCSYNIINIRNNIGNTISHEYENIIYSINKYNFINLCSNSSFCYNINISYDINSYPFLGITNFIFYTKSYDIIQGCDNMKSLYLYITWLLTDNNVNFILKNYTISRIPFNIVVNIINKLNSLKCEYKNGNIVFIKDIQNYSKIIYGSGSSLIVNLQLILQEKFYELYGINIIYDSINSYDGIDNIKNNNYLFALSEIIDYNNSFFIIPSFISPILFILNNHNTNNLIFTIDEIKNIFIYNNSNFIKIIRDNKSGIYNSLFYNEKINTYENEEFCNFDYCNKEIIFKINFNYYFLLFIIIIIYIIIVLIFFIQKDDYFIKLSKIKYNKDDINNILFKGTYNKKKVIIKYLDDDLSYMSIKNKYYKNDIKKFCKLNHPNIIYIFGYTYNNMIVMECMHLGSLYDVLYKSTIKIDNFFILNTIQQIIEGISFLHNLEKPIIHNNLKTTNILVNNNLNIKISDFNILNKKNSIYNKNIYYIAPEVLENNNITKASDIYSFGIILYELINLKEPYYDINENIYVIIKSILDKENPLRPTNTYNINTYINDLLIKCWKHDYNLRPSIEIVKKSVDFFKNDLENNINKIVKYTKSMHNVLTDMFPNNISNNLLYSKDFLPITFKNVTILVLDICNYTIINSENSNDIIINLLDRFYNNLDDLVIALNLVKIGNIGDYYIVCNNLEENTIDEDNIKCVAFFGLEAIKIASKTYIDINNLSLGTIQIRIGINYGDTIGHVIGKITKRFSLFGDTINLASRMESHSEPMKMQCTKDFALMIKNIDDNFVIENRGFINIKSKGFLNTFFINSYNGKYDININEYKNIKEIKSLSSIFSETLKNLIQKIEN